MLHPFSFKFKMWPWCNPVDSGNHCAICKAQAKIKIKKLVIFTNDKKFCVGAFPLLLAQHDPQDPPACDRRNEALSWVGLNQFLTRANFSTTCFPTPQLPSSYFFFYDLLDVWSREGISAKKYNVLLWTNIHSAIKRSFFFVGRQLQLVKPLL